MSLPENTPSSNIPAKVPEQPVAETPAPEQQTAAVTEKATYETIFCNNCGQKIAKAAVVCPHCGVPVAQNQQPTQQPIIINNSNNNVNSNTVTATAASGNLKNKWVAVLLCLFLGFFGAHKFYEGKILLGIVYLFTFGLFGIGDLVDLIVLLGKPNPYTV